MENMYYDQEADLCYTMEEEYIHPLDEFFNLERYEGETSAHLFIRMVDIFRKVPSDIMPSHKELIRKFRELGISPKDPDLMLLFQILDESLSYISPLDAYLNLEKQEDESATEFFLRMFNAYQEISSEYKPPSCDLLYRMRELGLLYDHQFLNFLEFMDNELVAKDNECRIEVTDESSEISDLNGNENSGYSKKESAHDDIRMFTGDSECKNDEENSLSVEEISALLDLEYQKHIEKSGLNFFSIHHGEQVDESVHSKEVLDERSNHSKKSYYEDEIELYTMYEQEEVLEYIDDEDIPLAGQADYDSQSDEVSTLFDETFDDPGESSFEAMPEFSMFINPLFEEQAEKQVIEDSSEFTTFSNPLYEEDFSCSQIHQHHDEDSGSDFEIDETHEVHSEGEISSSSSHEQELQQTYEDDVESAKHDEENMLENRSEIFSSIISNGVLDKGEVAHEEKHLEDGADCVQDNQAGKTHSNICIIDQKYDSTHLPFSRDHREHDDFLKAKHGMDIKDCINLVEAINVACRNSSIVFRKSEVLRDENCVFDRGKKYRSHFGGPGATQFHVHHAKHECTVCSSRDSWNLAMLTGSIRPQ